MDKNNIGHWGEERAAEYLRRHGYKILEMNYACRVGEIDIIARKRGILHPAKEVVFVEVKLRKSDRYGEAKDFVDEIYSRLSHRAFALFGRREGAQNAPQGVFEAAKPPQKLI